MGVIGVLVLVDQDVPEAALIQRGHLGEGSKEVHRLPDEVIEVERVRPSELSRVLAEDLDENTLSGVIEVDAAGVALHILKLVLEFRDASLSRTDGESIGIGVELFDDALEQCTAIGGVVDREVLGETEHLGLTTKDPHTRRVKSADPHPLGGSADQALDTLAHLGGRLVGEGDRENLARPRLPTLEQAGDPSGQHARLTGAGTGHDEQCGPPIQNRLTLLRIESIEEGRFARCGRIENERHGTAILGAASDVARGPGGEREVGLVGEHSIDPGLENARELEAPVAPRSRRAGKSMLLE